MSRRKPDVDDFYKLSKVLKDAGDKKMRARLHKSMKDAVKPVRPKARAEAINRLPEKGGLNKDVAKSRITPQVKTARNSYGVRLVVGKNGSGARSANRGKILHPTFGDREKWVEQDVPPGWFDDVCDAEKPAIKRDVSAAVKQVMNDIARGVR